jgi:hypothetical protein
MPPGPVRSHSLESTPYRHRAAPITHPRGLGDGGPLGGAGDDLLVA